MEKKVYESHKQSTCIIVKQGGRVVRFERSWAYPGCQAGFADIHVPHQNTFQTQFFPKGIFLFHVDILRPARVFLHTLYILRLTWARTHARTKSWRGYTEPEGDGSGTRPMTGCSNSLEWQFPRKKKECVFYLFPVSSYILDIHTYNEIEMKTTKYQWCLNWFKVHVKYFSESICTHCELHYFYGKIYNKRELSKITRAPTFSPCSFHSRNDIKQDNYIHCSYAVKLWYAYILKGIQNVYGNLD